MKIRTMMNGALFLGLAGLASAATAATHEEQVKAKVYANLAPQVKQYAVQMNLDMGQPTLIGTSGRPAGTRSKRGDTDIVICEQVQRGMRSRAYDTGRFSAKRENGVYHFQNLVREFLGE